MHPNHFNVFVDGLRLGVAFPGGVPPVMQIRETPDAGRPIVATEPDSEHAKPCFAIAEKVWAVIGKAKAAAKP